MNTFRVNLESDTDEKLLEQLVLMVANKRLAKESYHIGISLLIVTIAEARFAEINLSLRILLVVEFQFTHRSLLVSCEPNFLVEEFEEARVLTALELGE